MNTKEALVCKVDTPAPSNHTGFDYILSHYSMQWVSELGCLRGIKWLDTSAVGDTPSNQTYSPRNQWYRAPSCFPSFSPGGTTQIVTTSGLILAEHHMVHQ